MYKSLIETDSPLALTIAFAAALTVVGVIARDARAHTNKSNTRPPFADQSEVGGRQHGVVHLTARPCCLDGDEVEDLGRVSDALINALKHQPGEFMRAGEKREPNRQWVQVQLSGAVPPPTRSPSRAERHVGTGSTFKEKP